MYQDQVLRSYCFSFINSRPFFKLDDFLKFEEILQSLRTTMHLTGPPAVRIQHLGLSLGKLIYHVHVLYVLSRQLYELSRQHLVKKNYRLENFTTEGSGKIMK